MDKSLSVTQIFDATNQDYGYPLNKIEIGYHAELGSTLTAIAPKQLVRNFIRTRRTKPELERPIAEILTKTIQGNKQVQSSILNALEPIIDKGAFLNAALITEVKYKGDTAKLSITPIWRANLTKKDAIALSHQGEINAQTTIEPPLQPKRLAPHLSTSPAAPYDGS